MTPLPKDSLDIVEMVMVIEEVFGTEIPNGDGEGFGNPREIVDWLETHLSNQRPNKKAADFLRKLAKKQRNPELAEGLEGPWRRDQIAAIIREILK
jgi:acyl carrier protein